MAEDIIGTIREFLEAEHPHKAAQISKLSVDDSLTSAEILDSVGLLSLVTFIEARWDIKVSPKEFRPERFSTLNLVRTFVQGKLGA